MSVAGFVLPKLAGLEIPAQDMERTGFSGGFSLSDELDMPAAQNIFYNSGKMERYSILAVLTRRGVSRAVSKIEDRQPFGLIRGRISNPRGSGIEEVVIESFSGNMAFSDVRDGFETTLQDAFEWEFLDLEAISSEQPDLPISTIYLRFKEWCRFRERYLGASPKPLENIIGGILTAVVVFNTIVHSIEPVYKKEHDRPPNPDEWISIAMNSRSFAEHLAKIGIEDFKILGHITKVNDKIGGPSYIGSEYFTLRPMSNGEKLSLTPEAYSLAARMPSDGQIGSSRTPRLGCPAMVDFGNGTAIAALYGWYVGVAGFVYRNVISKNKY